MAATSPYQNNDYQAVSTFRPYTLPINDIFRSISAQDEYWNMGARRVKSVYENALGLSLVTDENRQIRDQFMKDADKQLTKLSSMDLSDPGVQRQGMNIYAPLLKDENMVGEDYVVKNLTKEYQTGLSYRTKGDGKQFNPLSLENIQFEKSLLSTDLNKRDGWKSLYQNMSTYTPFSDVSGEYKKILDLLKANEIEKATIEGNDWYIQEINEKGVSKERVMQAIEEMGSPQLKAQMRVEGRNTYYKHLASNPAGVDGYFQNVATRLFDGKIADMTRNKAELEYQKYLLPENNEPRTKAAKDNFNTAIIQVEKNINDLQSQKLEYLQEFTGLADMSRLSGNLSKVEQLWQSASIHEIAPTLAWESSSQKLRPNSAKIAQENINVAVQRINLGYQTLAETKRHNLVSEEDKDLDREVDLIKALRTGGGSTSSTSVDPIFGGSGADGTGGLTLTDTPQTASPNLSTALEIGAKVRENLLNMSEEPLREVAISSIIGPNAWAGLQQNADKGGTIGLTGALTDNEMQRAAEFWKAFADKYGGKTIQGQSSSTFITAGGDVEHIKASISKMDVGKFKRIMGNMIKHDTEFSSDIILKLAESETDPKRKRLAEENAASLRGEINKTIRAETNLSDNIYKVQVPALGSYAKYFDNGGRVPLTDANILKAYKNAGNKLVIYTKAVERTNMRGDYVGEQNIPITEQEYNRLKASGAKNIGVKVPSAGEFISAVRNQTDPLFANMSTQFNTKMATINFGDGKDRDPRALQKIQSLRNLVPAANTDMRKKIDTYLNFIETRESKVAGYNLFTPGLGESTPSAQFIMSGLSEADQETWAKLKDFKVPVLAKDPQFYKTSNPSGQFRYPGAVLVMAPANNPEKGHIKIVNESRDPQGLDPLFQVKDIYSLVKDNGKLVPVPITGADIQAAVEAKYNMPIAEILEKDLDGANKVIAGILTRIELMNKKLKEEVKK